MLGGQELELPAEVDDLMGKEAVDRFGISGDDQTIELAPALADRPSRCSSSSATATRR
jgi:hypothetical protein